MTYPITTKKFTLNIKKFACIFSWMIVNAVIMIFAVAIAYAGQTKSGDMLQIQLERISVAEDSGYAYRLQYYVPAPIKAFWRFKTDFNSEIVLTNDELVGHRLVEVNGNVVITENRYATAPGLKFLWQTSVLDDKYRLDFKLLNAEDCRHDFHYGSIQLSPAGDFTMVTQTAYFDFRGASLWVKYPWYGGMKHTLTKVAEWEQKVASEYREIYLAMAVE